MKPANKILTLLGGASSISYALQDEFTDTAAAGSVNGTLATDGVNARTVTDTNNKLSLGLGVANFATGGAAAGDPGLWYPAVARASGKALITKLSGTFGSSRISVGFDTNQLTSLIWGVNFFSTPSLRVNTYSGSPVVVGTSPANDTVVYTAVIQRAAGMFFFIKEATAYPDWTLIYVDTGGSEASIYPAVQTAGTTSIFSVDFMRMPTDVITITPLASDAFTRANGNLGNTGGGGSGEAGGSGLAWTVQNGTGAIATNKATFSALTGGLGIATVDTGAADVMAEVVATRTAGNMGLVLRWTDANNFISIYHDGTNLIAVETVAGTPNTLFTTAATYGATKRLQISLKGSALRAYYGDALVNTATTAITTGNNHGLYTSDTGATFDNFIVWNKAGGAYNTALNNFLA